GRFACVPRSRDSFGTNAGASAGSGTATEEGTVSERIAARNCLARFADALCPVLFAPSGAISGLQRPPFGSATLLSLASDDARSRQVQSVYSYSGIHGRNARRSPRQRRGSRSRPAKSRTDPLPPRQGHRLEPCWLGEG